MMKKDFLILVAIAILGMILRLLFLPQGALTFGYDQARDAYSALEILNGHLKILGPPASTPGLFHGVLYYYLIAPSYWLGNGSPYVTAIWIALVNILTIIPIYFLGRLLFSSKVGLIAAFLFTISFDAVQYALWLSNPTPAVFSGAIFYLGLAVFIFDKKKILGLILAALGLGLSTQFEVFLGYLFVPLIIALAVFKVRPTLKQTLLFFLVFIITVSSMILSYIKFGPTFIGGFASLFAGGGDPFGNWREFSPTLLLYLNRFVEYFYRGLLPFNVGFAGFIAFLITFAVIVWAKDKDNKFRKGLIFLLIVIFSHGILIPFGGVSTPFINAGLQEPIMLLVAFFLFFSYKKYKVWITLLSVLIIFSSLYATFKYNPQGQTVFAIQRGLILKNELAAVEYTYNAAGQNNFSINTITSPLWINTVWAYLYNWYGQNKYGFVPSFHGRNQAGYLGSLPEVSSQDKSFFLIIEPTAGIPTQFVEGTIGNEDSFSKIVEERDFGGIIVQKRILTKPFTKINFIR